MSEKHSSQQRFQFDFNWKITLFVVFLFPVLLLLGFWQLDRADEKRVLESNWLQNQALPVLELEKLQDQHLRAPYFRRIRISGEFLTEKYWLRENQIHNGKLGYQVIMLFKTQAEQLIAVDRGWVEGSPLRDFVPQIATPRGMLSISGSLTVPSDSKLVREAEVSAKSWPHKILEIDLDVMASQIKQEVQPKLLLLDADSRGALLVNWRPINMSPEKHVGYAVQWFALALALIVLYIFASTNLGDIIKQRRVSE